MLIATFIFTAIGTISALICAGIAIRNFYVGIRRSQIEKYIGTPLNLPKGTCPSRKEIKELKEYHDHWRKVDYEIRQSVLRREKRENEKMLEMFMDS